MADRARQNVTITLPRELLQKLRHRAVDAGQSLSAFVADVLDRSVHTEDVYDQARRRQVELMRKGLNLGTHGRITWTRDELHERD